MNSAELRRYLASQGCTFETHKGGSGHITVRRGDRKSQIPMHGGRKELGEGGEQDTQGFRPEMTLAYRVKLQEDDNGTLLVTCRVLPEVTTFGDDETAAMARARDVIEEALAARIGDGQDIPKSDTKGPHLVRLPALTTLKVELYCQLRLAGTTRAELARRLHWNRESVDRLFRLDHNSRLDQLEAAFKALGRNIDIEVAAA
jgi:antitoxin HicB